MAIVPATANAEIPAAGPAYSVGTVVGHPLPCWHLGVENPLGSRRPWATPTDVSVVDIVATELRPEDDAGTAARHHNLLVGVRELPLRASAPKHILGVRQHDDALVGLALQPRNEELSPRGEPMPRSSVAHIWKRAGPSDQVLQDRYFRARLHHGQADSAAG